MSLNAINGEKSVGPIFDLSEALNRVDEDIDFLREVIEVFIEDYPNQIRQLQEGVASGDADAVERAAHTLKSSLANLAGKRASDVAYRLEVLGREGNLEAAKGALANLEQEVKVLEQTLRSV